MIMRIRPLGCLLAALGALTLLLGGSSVPRAQFLPVFTSPIDITGLKIQLRLFAPDREGFVTSTVFTAHYLPYRWSRIQ